MLRPSNSMVPAVGSSAASTSFDVVVLPHPALPKSEPPTGKCLRRSRTASSELSTRGGLLLDGQPAPHVAVTVRAVLPGLLDAAPVGRPLAAGVEGAASREGREVRRLARNAVERLPDAELRNRVEQRPGVRMAGAVEEVAYRLH